MQHIKWYTIPLFAAVIAISSALILQYFGGYRPCELCYTQRYIWYITAVIAIVALLFKKNIFIIPLLLLLLASIIVSFYQGGMVSEWWTGAIQCSTGKADISALNDLNINNLTFQPSCSSIDQKLFNFLPLPFANSLLAFAAFVTTFILFVRSYR